MLFAHDAFVIGVSNMTGGRLQGCARLAADQPGPTATRDGDIASSCGQEASSGHGWWSLLDQLGLLGGTDSQGLKGRNRDTTENESKPALQSGPSGVTASTLTGLPTGGDLRALQPVTEPASDTRGLAARIAKMSGNPAALLKAPSKWTTTQLDESKSGLSSVESRRVVKQRQCARSPQLAIQDGPARQINTESFQTGFAFGETLRCATPIHPADSIPIADRGKGISFEVKAEHPEQVRVDGSNEQDGAQPASMESIPGQIGFKERSEQIFTANTNIAAYSPNAPELSISAAASAPKEDGTKSRIAPGTMDDWQNIPQTNDGASSSLLHSAVAPSMPPTHSHQRRLSSTRGSAAMETGLPASGSSDGSALQRVLGVTNSGEAIGLRESKSMDQAGRIEQGGHPVASSPDRPEQHWVHTGPRFAEAGFQDPSLGWVSVRAERDATGLHAVLVPPSHDAVRTLSAHLSGLNAHLEQNHIQMSPVTMSATRESQMDSGVGSERHKDTSGNRGYEEGDSSQSRNSRRTDAISSSLSLKTSDDPSLREMASLRVRTSDFYGAHISLVA